MSYLRVLFDIAQVIDPVPARVFFRALFSAVDPRLLAGCALYHGFSDQPGSYCIVVYSDDAPAVGALARAAMNAKWNLATQPRVIVDQGALRTDRLALAAKVSPQGLLDDVQLDPLIEIWRDAQAQYQTYSNPPRQVPEAPPQSFYPRDPAPSAREQPQAPQQPQPQSFYPRDPAPPAREQAPQAPQQPQPQSFYPRDPAPPAREQAPQAPQQPQPQSFYPRDPAPPAREQAPQAPQQPQPQSFYPRDPAPPAREQAPQAPQQPQPQSFYPRDPAPPMREQFPQAPQQPQPQSYYPRDPAPPIREVPHPSSPATLSLQLGSLYDRPTTSTAPLPQDPYEAPRYSGASSLRRHPNFPKSAPPALEAPAARDRTFAAVAGGVIGLLLAIAVFALTPKNTLLFQMFDFRKPATIIPVTILMMFFWGCGICFFRWRRLGAMEGISKPELLREAIPMLDNLGLHGLRADLEEPVVAFSPLLKRMRAAVNQWSMHPSLQDTDVVLQQLADSDEEGIHTSYSLARTFVWALPVLGLIGTVIGISGAVGGFAQFLGGSIDDVNIIKQNLVNVTGGLSFAFLITLEGLLTSLILMLAASSLQTRERELYARAQDDVADQLVPALQRVAPEAYKTQGKQGMDLSGIREILSEQAANSASQMSVAGDRLLSAMEAKHAEWMSKLSSLGTGLLEATRSADTGIWKNAQERMALVAREISAGLDRAATQAGTGLAQHNEEFLVSLRTVFGDLSARQSEMVSSAIQRQQEADRTYAANMTQQQALMQKAGSGLAQQNEEFLVSLRTIFGDFSARQSEMASSAVQRQQEADRVLAANIAQQQALMQKLTEQSETIRSSANAVAALSETTQRILQCQQDLHKALNDLEGGPARAAFDGFAQALNVSSGEMAKIMQSAENLGRLTNQIVSAQALLQQATQQLADSQFSATMSDFRKSMVSLAPVLASFQKPFVLQAVPFAPDGPA